MATLLEISSSVVLYSANSYPKSNAEAREIGLSGTRNQEMRAMTLAAFRVAQNNDQLSQRMMANELLSFLLAGSSSAINHWIRMGRLTREGEWLRLEERGLAECQNTLLGSAGAYSTTEAKVMEWVQRLLHGDDVAHNQREFSETLWQAST